MSVARRIISGSASSWVRIVLTLVTQLALVPVYLSYWSVTQFGIWIAIQALVNMLVVFDRGYTDYLGFEFLKFGNQQPGAIRSYLWSGISVLVILAIVESILLFSIFILIPFPAVQSFFTTDNISGIEIGWAVITQWLSWIVLNFCGLIFRGLVPFGYYPRMGWWSVIAAVFGAMVTLVVVMSGGGILAASVSLLCSNVVITIIQLIDVQRLTGKHSLQFEKIQWNTGFKSLYRSVLLSLRYFFEGFRQQGIRLLLTPLIGLAGVAAFSTMRTASNVLLQGISTVASPVLPELMSFLKARDQDKTDAAFHTIWLAVVFLLAPGALLLQFVAPPLFNIWTNGQIIFNPSLFALVSISVLIFALAQPAISILVGNNHLRVQMVLAMLSMVILVICCLILVPLTGITGAGWALLLAEISVLAGARLATNRWLQARSMTWPARSSNMATMSVVNSGIGLMSIALFPEYRWLCLIIFFSIAIYIIRRFWLNLPQLMHSRIKVLFKRFQFVG